MPLTVHIKSQARKDIRALKRQGWDTALLTDALNRLANREPLPRSMCDHPLHGDMAGCRECHIQGDWLLIYRIIEEIHTNIDEDKNEKKFDIECCQSKNITEESDITSWVKNYCVRLEFIIECGDQTLPKNDKKRKLHFTTVFLESLLQFILQPRYECNLPFPSLISR